MVWSEFKVANRLSELRFPALIGLVTKDKKTCIMLVFDDVGKGMKDFFHNHTEDPRNKEASKEWRKHDPADFEVVIIARNRASAKQFCDKINWRKVIAHRDYLCRKCDQLLPTAA